MTDSEQKAKQLIKDIPGAQYKKFTNQTDFEIFWKYEYFMCFCVAILIT